MNQLDKTTAQPVGKRAFRVALAGAVMVLLTGCLGGREVDERAAHEPGQSPRAESAELRQCYADLASTGAEFTPLEDKYYGGGCAMLGTVQLRALQSDDGQIALTNLGPVDCQLALKFAGWARYGVGRASEQILGSRLDRIETMGSYSCRNVAGTGRRSAHSRAQAIDIGSFVLEDGRRVRLLTDWSDGDANTRQFLRVVQNSACKRFGTVLGPDYNAAHRDHFHIELSGGGFCR